MIKESSITATEYQLLSFGDFLAYLDCFSTLTSHANVGALNARNFLILLHLLKSIILI